MLRCDVHRAMCPITRHSDISDGDWYSGAGTDAEMGGGERALHKEREGHGTRTAQAS